VITYESILECRIDEKECVFVASSRYVILSPLCPISGDVDSLYPLDRVDQNVAHCGSIVEVRYEAQITVSAFSELCVTYGDIISVI